MKIGPYDFEHVNYDARGDVLYLRTGDPAQATETHATPEGHAVRVDATGQVIGITIVNAKWLAERDGKVTITVPRLIETSAEVLAPALTE
jgi:uncharacterized protein YuzE